MYMDAKPAWRSGSVQHCCGHGRGLTPGQGLGSVPVGCVTHNANYQEVGNV